MSNLDDLWRGIQSISDIANEVNNMYAKYFKDEDWKPTLIDSYKVQLLMMESKRKLIDLAIIRILNEHGIINAVIPDKVKHDLLKEEGFSYVKVEEAIKEYIDNADDLAYRKILADARRLLPTIWEVDKGIREPRIDEIVKKKKLILRIWWNFGSVSFNSLEALTALGKIINIVLGKEKPSKAATIGLCYQVELFRGSDYSQVRTYHFSNKYIEKFRIYKNGKLEITFKKESYAKRVAKALLKK